MERKKKPKLSDAKGTKTLENHDGLLSVQACMANRTTGQSVSAKHTNAKSTIWYQLCIQSNLNIQRKLRSLNDANGIQQNYLRGIQAKFFIVCSVALFTLIYVFHPDSNPHLSILTYAIVY